MKRVPTEDMPGYFNNIHYCITCPHRFPLPMKVDAMMNVHKRKADSLVGTRFIASTSSVARVEVDAMNRVPTRSIAILL